MLESCVISGSIALPNAIVAPYSKVQALDRDLPSLELRPGSIPRLLGEAITDAQGHFTIIYAPDNFTRSDAIKSARSLKDKAVDLSFRVFDSAEQELAIQRIEALNRTYQANQIIFNAPPHLEVKLYIAAQSQATDQSEFETLFTLLAPIIRDIPHADLSDDDISFLTHELGLEKQPDVLRHIEWLKRSALLARETNQLAETFYGLGRKGYPLCTEETGEGAGR